MGVGYDGIKGSRGIKGEKGLAGPSGPNTNAQFGPNAINSTIPFKGVKGGKGMVVSLTKCLSEESHPFLSFICRDAMVDPVIEAPKEKWVLADLV